MNYNNPIFVSLVVVFQNRAAEIEEKIRSLQAILWQCECINDFEIILVDNGSSDGTEYVLNDLAGESGLPCLEVFVLGQPIDVDAATCLGLKASLGDAVLVVDPWRDDITQIARLLSAAEESSLDVVFARNIYVTRPRKWKEFFYQKMQKTFERMYELITGVCLTKQAPRYRLLRRHAVNHVTKQRDPSSIYRAMPLMAGFSCGHLEYNMPCEWRASDIFWQSVDRSIRLLVTTTRAPLRLASSLALLAACLNVFYSFYVLLIAVISEHVAAGWISLSLQQSGMFFLVSLVLAILSEYVLILSRQGTHSPSVHIVREMTSQCLQERPLNVETAP